MKLVAYIRVSTQKQGASGLGLEGQIADIAGYARSVNGEVVQTYREIETGRRDDRPQLERAKAHAKRIKARLVIAKLDRLARDVCFVSTLMKGGVDFVCCDNPNANKLTIHLLSAVAEHEAEQISARTKAALRAAKERGIKLGSARPGHWKGREERRLAGAIAGAAIAKEQRDKEALPVYAAAAKVIGPMRDEDASLREMAEALNDAGLTTVRGAAWSAVQVSRLLASGFVPAMIVATVGAVVTN